jgi:hypothetical protein
MRQQRLQSHPTLNRSLHLFDFPLREFPPPRPHRRIIPQTDQKYFDLAQRKSHLTGEAEKQHAMHRVVRIPPLSPPRCAAASNPSAS